jgi:hypothetical protein
MGREAVQTGADDRGGEKGAGMIDQFTQEEGDYGNRNRDRGTAVGLALLHQSLQGGAYAVV